MSRSHEHEIEIHAPITAVWKALTDPDEIARWFVESAAITPGEGGTFRMNHGPGGTSESRVAAWEPGRLLRLVSVVTYRPFQDRGSEPEPHEEVEEYVLEERGDITVVRMVQSGIPDSAGWDGFYDGTNKGWEIVLRGLRHYLEKHPGQPRRAATIGFKKALPAEQAWAAVTGPRGIGIGDGSGERFRATTTWGEVLEGEILHAIPNRGILATVETLGDALLSVGVEREADDTVVWLTVSTFGAARASIDDLRARWTKFLGEALDVEEAVSALYRRMLNGWNSRSGEAFAAPLAEDGVVIGFDGSRQEGRSGIAGDIQRIFDDHATGTYVANVKSVRSLAPDVALLEAIAGLVPAGRDDIDPQLNARQTVTAVRRDGEWRIALLQNTPAQFHGRPELVLKMADELREARRPA